MFEKRKNSYYRLLMGEQTSQRKDRQKRRTRWLQGFIVVALLPFIFKETIVLSCGCSMILVMSPIFVATAFAQTSASHSGTADYELITITPLSDEHIVWGQFYSTLDRKSHWRQIPYGLVPVAYALILLGISVTFALEEARDWQVVPTIICIVISFAGVYWLLNVIGIALGLAIRRLGVASWTMTGISIVSLAIWGIFVPILLDPSTRPHWTLYILFAMVPYLPIVPILFLAYHFARNPVINLTSS